MKKRLLCLLAAVVVLATVLPTAALASSITLTYDSSINSDSWEVLRLTNQHRMSIGLNPLSTNDKLQMVANQRATELITLYSHNRPDGSECYTAWDDYNASWHAAAENIASGFTTAAAVVDGWLNSEGHRANIEDAALTHLGVGSVSRNWSQNFSGDSSCSYSGLSLSQYSISGVVGQGLEEMLTAADIKATATCSIHGSCYLPLIAGMCSGYNSSTAGTQNITVSLGGRTTTLSVTLRVSCASHVYDSGRVTQEAKCFQTGVKTYTCTVCGATKTETIARTSHTYGPVQVTQEATCYQTGAKTYSCTVCGITMYATISKTSHVYDGGRVTKEATCVQTGVRTYTCTVCGTTKTEAIATTSHTYDKGKVTREATCVQTGVRTYTCTVCGTARTETIATTEHVYRNGVCVTCGRRNSTSTSNNNSNNNSNSGTNGGSNSNANSGTSDAADSVADKTSTEVTVVVGDDNVVSYTGKAQKPAVAVLDANGEGIDSGEYSVEYGNNKDVASADDENAPYVTVTAKSNGKYVFTNANDNGEVVQKFTIQGAKITLSNVKNITTTYTGSDVTQDKKIKAKLKGTAKAGKTTVKGTWSFVDTGIVNASDEPYTVTVKFTPNDKNYSAKTTTIQLTVNPAKISVKKVTLADKALSKVVVGRKATVKSVTFNGLVGADKNSFFGYTIDVGTYTKAKKGSQKISYTITLTSKNYTFGGKGGGTTKTGTASAKITAG